MSHLWIRKTFRLTANSMPVLEGRLAKVESAVRRQGGVLLDVARTCGSDAASATLVYELPRSGPFDVVKVRPTGYSTSTVPALG